MKKKIWIVLFMLTAAASFIMAGAGEEKAGEGKTVVHFFHRWPQEPRFSYYNQIVADFEKQNPNIKIEMDSVLNDSYKEKIRVLVSSNDIPDVFVSWSDSFAYNLVQSGRIKVLNEMLAKDKAFADTLIKPQIQPFTFNNNIYGLPFTIDGKVFVYNREIFSKAGITKAPASFTELLNILETLKKAGHETPILEGLQDTWTIAHYQGTIFQRILPRDVLERDFTEKTGEFTHAGYKQGMERFQQLVTYMGPNATSLDHTTVRNLFIAGRLPLMYIQLAEFGYIQADNPSLDYGIFNFPAIEGGAGDPSYLTGAPEGFMMSNTSKAPEAAELLYKFLYSTPNAEKFVKDVRAPVGIIGAVNANNSYPKLMEAIDLIMETKAYPWFDNAVNIKIADAFMRGAQSVATGDKTVDQVLAEVRAAAQVVRSEAK
ncbi:MAG: extracellular solute-binding protein [Treponema sp.]|jgi:raffinose/stachyose/melibiose transport system substrate-binding protein|nr:extracellular solute-binding protein [Treponema sp.]